jgi:Fur family peroxide stress response transcriptional regulator
MVNAMLRRSKQRAAILKVLRSTSSHPTADWVYDQVKKEIPNISFGTVYRNLKLLKDAGEILELDLAAGPSRYNHNVHDHYHFRCNRCGRVFDLDEPVDKDINKRVTANTGLDITGHVLEFRGLCKDCKT